MEAAAALPPNAAAGPETAAAAATADSPPASPPASTAARDEATAFLSTLLNKTLVVHTTDGRFFVGTFKFTDWDCNVVLARATEYRQPSPRQREEAAKAMAAAAAAGGAASDRLVMNMQERDLGLIVVPGRHIVKIELEEFASQIRQREGNSQEQADKIRQL